MRVDGIGGDEKYQGEWHGDITIVLNSDGTGDVGYTRGYWSVIGNKFTFECLEDDSGNSGNPVHLECKCELKDNTLTLTPTLKQVFHEDGTITNETISAEDTLHLTR